MASLLEVVDGYLKEMGLDPRKCSDPRFPDCRFLQTDGACLMVIAREDPRLGRTLGFIAKLELYEPADREAYLEELLKLNFEMVHGAFAIDRSTREVVVIDNLQADHIDFDEFYASVTRTLEAASRYNRKAREGCFDAASRRENQAGGQQV